MALRGCREIDSFFALGRVGYNAQRYVIGDEDDNGTNGGIGSTRAGGEGAYGGATVNFLF